MQRSNLISVQELQGSLDHSNLIVLDCSWFLPASMRDVQAEFQHTRIRGAAFFDIDQISDTASHLPHMLPSVEYFESAVTGLGVATSSHVVVYDTAGLFSAARVWWMFKVFGHRKVQVLNGGLPAWLDADGATDSGSETPQIAKIVQYKAHFDETFLADQDVLKKNSKTGEYLVLDARAKKRFTGEAPEPRADLPSGHMPNSKSLSFDRLIENGHLKPVSQLKSIFDEYGLQQPDGGDDTKLITSCGSGVTAAIVTLALSESGFGLQKLYDGAWSEWAALSDTVVLQGE